MNYTKFITKGTLMRVLAAFMFVIIAPTGIFNLGNDAGQNILAIGLFVALLATIVTDWDKK